MGLFSAKYRIVIASNAMVSNTSDIRRALLRVGLSGFLDEIFTLSELGLRKSQPEFWAYVLASLGVDPGEAVMIGDSLEQDVLAPRAAGIRGIWFRAGRADVAVPEGIEWVTSLRDLAGLLLEEAEK